MALSLGAPAPTPAATAAPAAPPPADTRPMIMQLLEQYAEAKRTLSALVREQDAILARLRADSPELQAVTEKLKEANARDQATYTALKDEAIKSKSGCDLEGVGKVSFSNPMGKRYLVDRILAVPDLLTQPGLVEDIKLNDRTLQACIATGKIDPHVAAQLSIEVPTTSCGRVTIKVENT